MNKTTIIIIMKFEGGDYTKVKVRIMVEISVGGETNTTITWLNE